jgi:iron complex transport system permease protein
VAFGVRSVGWSDILPGVMGGDEDIAQAAVRKRVPRTVPAMIVGGSLGLAGAVMQGVTRNPLADPGMLGVTSGASLCAVIGIAFFRLASPVAFHLGGDRRRRRRGHVRVRRRIPGSRWATPLRLTLAGAASSAAFTSLISAILLPRIES